MNTRKYIILLGFSCFYTVLLAQKNNAYFRSIEYYDKTDSTKNYAIVYRPNGPAQKMLVLLPSLGESPQLAEIETDIPQVAATKGIMTVILCNNEGSNAFQIDGNSQYYLDSIIPILLKRNNIPNDAYYMGGFSLGGSGVVKYVQHCAIYDIYPKPKAVFTIDPPLDFVRLYKVYEQWLNDSTAYFSNKPFYKILLEKMRSFFKGNIYTAYENYVTLSPYSNEDKNNYGARLFGSMPILTYCEPDFLWAMKEKHWNAYDLNVLDNVGFINELNILGNKNAKLILTKDKGIRKIVKVKHPHSWSIADAQETIKWLLQY